MSWDRPRGRGSPAGRPGTRGRGRAAWGRSRRGQASAGTRGRGPRRPRRGPRACRPRGSRRCRRRQRRRRRMRGGVVPSAVVGGEGRRRARAGGGARRRHRRERRTGSSAVALVGRAERAGHRQAADEEDQHEQRQQEPALSGGEGRGCGHVVAPVSRRWWPDADGMRRPGIAITVSAEVSVTGGGGGASWSCDPDPPPACAPAVSRGRSVPMLRPWTTRHWRAGSRRVTPSAWADVYDRYADRLSTTPRRSSTIATRPRTPCTTPSSRPASGSVSRDPDRLRPWLYAVCRTTALGRARRRSRMVPTEEVGAVIPTPVSADPVEETSCSGWCGTPPRASLPRTRRCCSCTSARASRVRSWRGAGGVRPPRQRPPRPGPRAGGALAHRAARGPARATRLRRARRAAGGMGRPPRPRLRKRVARHIDDCDVCEERRRTVVSPLGLLAAMPIMPAPPSCESGCTSIRRAAGRLGGGGAAGAAGGLAGWRCRPAWRQASSSAGARADATARRLRAR